MKIVTGLYVKNSAEAVELYIKAFGLELGYNVKNSDGSYYHSELFKNGVQLIDVVENTNESNKESIVQICVELENEQEVRHAFALLSEGGEVVMPLCPLAWSPLAATVRDQFGVWWYFSANSHYPAEDYKPDDLR